MNRQAPEPGTEAQSWQSYGGQTPEERRAERRQRLMAAGLEIFGKRGFAQATMRDILSVAQLSNRYFAESFGSVEELFEAVYTELRTDLLKRLHEAMSLALPTAPTEVAAAGLRVFFAFVREDPRRARIMLIDVLGLRYASLGETQASLPYSVKPYVSMFSGFFRIMYPGIDRLEIDVELIHQTLIGMTVQSAAAWADKGFDKDLDDIVRHNLFAWQGLDHWVKSLLANAPAPR